MTQKHSMIAAALLLSTAAVPGYAAEGTLTIGVKSETTSMDPHFHNVATNVQVTQNVFESLVGQNAAQELEPQLATEWSSIADNTWPFKLRDGIKFQNGDAFTANDVIYSFCRVSTIENSPSSFAIYTAGITDMQVKDDNTLVITTAKPDPLVPVKSASLAIVSAKASGGTDAVIFKPEGCEGMGAATDSNAFNAPDVAVGTGPYVLKAFNRGNELVLTPNADYWGTAPQWQEVRIRPISSSGPRVAALLSGDVDMIESPPVQDVKRIEDAGYTIAGALSNRVIYLAMDQEDDAPSVTGTDGKNPFLNARVRKAMSLAIDRDAIVKRIMGGLAEPAGEFLPPPMFGASGRSVDAYDPEQARALLAEAGYPDGFGIVLGTPNDRYINDAQVAQAVAQMFARIGIKVQVDASTASQFFAKRNKFEFPVFLAGWGATTGEMSSPLMGLVTTVNKDEGAGAANFAHYSNPEVDKLVKQAIVTIDDDGRAKLLQQAGTVALDDYGVLPLHYEKTIWALAPGFSYVPRVDQFTVAAQVTKADAAKSN